MFLACSISLKCWIDDFTQHLCSKKLLPNNIQTEIEQIPIRCSCLNHKSTNCWVISTARIPDTYNSCTELVCVCDSFNIIIIIIADGVEMDFVYPFQLNALSKYIRPNGIQFGGNEYFATHFFVFLYDNIWIAIYGLVNAPLSPSSLLCSNSIQLECGNAEIRNIW